MSKFQTAKGILKTLWQMSKEEFAAMDHKLLRIGAGILSFIVSALLWFYVFRSMNPLHL